MLKKITLAVAALAVSAAFLGAGSASAAVLYKDATKIPKVLVPVGATFTVAQPTWNPEKGNPTAEQTWTQTRAPNPNNGCFNSSITFKVTQNNGTFKAVPTAANFPKAWCVREMKWANLEIAPGQELTVSGSSTANGTETAWLGTKFTFAWSLPEVGEAWLTPFTGATGSPPAKGVFVQQPTAAKAPISLNLANAAVPGGWLSASGTVSAKFIFTGEAATWSFG
jgi:hypothetical protein